MSRIKTSLISNKFEGKMFSVHFKTTDLLAKNTKSGYVSALKVLFRNYYKMKGLIPNTQRSRIHLDRVDVLIIQNIDPNTNI